MDLSQFKIGETFWMSGSQWRCTDIGTRTVCAIKLDDRDPEWFRGPPYAVVEHCLDENDLEACSFGNENNKPRREGEASEVKIGQGRVWFKFKKSGWFVCDSPPKIAMAQRARARLPDIASWCPRSLDHYTHRHRY